MEITKNTILITGGGSGIGLALADELSKLGNKIIVAGRSSDKLKVAAERGHATLTVDMMNKESIENLASQAVALFPDLNVVIHNAGIMRKEDVIAGDNKTTQEETILTNIMGPMCLTQALLPHLLKQKHSTIFTVTSGLAFTPSALYPTYCATKAALHSYSESLRYQLKDTSVKVKEIAPPYVQTELTGPQQAVDSTAMPLKEFISEVITLLKEQPENEEILVKRVLPLRNSFEGGKEKYKAFFKQFNDRIFFTRNK